MLRKCLFCTCILLINFPVATAALPTADDSPASEQGLVISEIKLGGGQEPKEYVELFNDSQTDLTIDGFQLEYAKPSFNPQGCNVPSWKSVAEPSSAVTVKSLQGSLRAQSFLVIDISLTDNTAGSLRLTSGSGASWRQYDLLGWGEQSPCWQGGAAALPPSGTSLKRYFSAKGKLAASTHHNVQDYLLATPSPGTDECFEGLCNVVDEEGEVTEPVPSTILSVIITELLIDPGSPKTDAQDEFIELYNPHAEAVSLTNYSLRLTIDTSVRYKVLTSFVLQPGEYRALYASETGLTLTNSKSGYAAIIAPDGSVLHQTALYPADIGTDQAWADDGESWRRTDTPTPGAANQFTETNLEALTAGAVLSPCPAGKFRNPETGRCKTAALASGAILTCKPNQERNPQTNRCRNIVVRSTPAPCPEGQVRNSSTKRCRKLAAVSKPSQCQTGYERNPQTNRCRKQAVVAGRAISRPANHESNNYRLLMVVAGLTVMYALYEYRQDVVNGYFRLRSRLIRMAGKT